MQGSLTLSTQIRHPKSMQGSFIQWSHVGCPEKKFGKN